MSYALRNTLVLTLLLLLVVAGGGWWVYVHQRGELARVNQKIAKTKGELQTMGDVQAALVSLTKKLDEAKARWRDLPKVIPPADDAAETYRYLNQIMSSPGSAVTFNFIHQASGGTDALRWNRYQITEGAGEYSDLYGFLWKLEHQRRLYGIEKLGMVELRTADERTGKPISRVAFAMDLIAYSMPGVEPPSAASGQFVELRPLTANPFRPLLYEDLPPNKENLVEVDKSDLMGISGSVIYIRDHMKKPRTLSVGDRVYLGRLARVDQTRGLATFELNEGGVGKTVTLSLTAPANTGEGE